MPGEFKVLLTLCGTWHLRQTAKAFENRNALAELWCTESNRTGIDPARFKRCWPFHLAMYPFYRLASLLTMEHAFYACFPAWRIWQRWQKWPDCQAVHAMMGYATEPFARAKARGALRVIDCPNSHPRNYYPVWQAECDKWCPGERVPVPQWMLRRMTREIEEADLVLCPSTFVYDTMLANSVPAAKCFISPFGVNTDTFKPSPAPPSVPRFVCVGTIGLRKGHQYLFPAFASVKKQLPQAELVCVGPIREEFRLEQQKWAGSYRHYSDLSHPELAKLLQECGVFVLVSIEEGFARVLVEAMAAGLPIIATHETGATTMVRDGAEGLIVPARDPEAIARAMLRLAADPMAARKMGEAARAKVAGQNSWQDYGDRLLTEYCARCRQKSQVSVP